MPGNIKTPAIAVNAPVAAWDRNHPNAVLAYCITVVVYHYVHLASPHLMTNRTYAIALANFIAFGPKTFARFRDAFPSFEAAWHASRTDLVAAGISQANAAKFLHFRGEHDPAEFAARCDEYGIASLVYGDDDYPPLLAEIYDPPAVLYIRAANTDDAKRRLAQNAVAFVGSRHCTAYGREACTTLATGVAAAGITVVSGLAYGIDEAAHRAALNAHGFTVAVLASGLLGIDNPRQHSLAQAMHDGGGALVSEFPLATTPRTHLFPYRNRIISGLCRATVVVEAGIPSGTLITARSAVDQNREVIAVPGPITSNVSAGTNRLIREGAHVATCAEDILDVLGVSAPSSAAPHTPSTEHPDPRAQRLLRVLENEPRLLDDIATHLAQSITETAALVAMLELEGRVTDIGGKRFALT